MLDVAVFLIVLFFTVWGMIHFTVSAADWTQDHVWRWIHHKQDP